jgi:hypothetical protein
MISETSKTFGPSHREFNSFIAGTLISSTGSNTYAIAALAFLPAAGYSLTELALMIIISRMATLLVSALLGSIGDVIDSRRILLWSEVIGILASLGLWLSWAAGRDYFSAFLIATAVRALAMAIQSPARNKLAKLYGDSGFSSQSKFAIWINKATSGSTVFAAILAFGFFKWSSLTTVIAFDCATFIVNGIVIYFLVNPKDELSHYRGILTLPRDCLRHTLYGFIEFYTSLKFYAVMDILLALSLTGINILTVRLVQGNYTLITVLCMITGAAV